MNAESVGLYVRGQFEMRRQNFESAIAAFSKAGNYPGALRQIANAIEGQGASAQEISEALLNAFQQGDLRALPWLVFESDRNGVEFSELKSCREELEKLIQNENQEVLGAKARLLIINGDYKKGVKLLEKAIGLNDPAARTFLAFICMSQELEPKLSKLIQKIGAKRIFSDSNQINESSISYVESLLDQGEDQNFYSANLALLQLNLATKSAGWISEHGRELISNPELFPSLWNDPEYLAEMSFAWLRSNTSADLARLIIRMKDFYLDDIFLELIEEVRIQAENETLFDDLFEDSESVPVISATPQREASLIQDATVMFGAELAIDDFLSILEAGDFNEFAEKCDLLVMSALQGNEKDYLRASQLIQFIFEMGANFGSYNRYSFYLQSDSLIKTFENQSISSAFIQELVPRLLTSRPINGGAKKMLSPETYEGLIQAVYFKKGVPSDISKDIEKAFPTVFEFWDIARRVIFYADEVSGGNFTHLKEFQEVIWKYYPNYQNVESTYFTEDWLWNVSVHETIDLALENHNALESNDFREFVLSLIELDPHFGCKLIYADLWGPSGGYEGLSKNESQQFFVTSEQLTEIIKFGTCDEDSGRDDSCLSNFTLVALHPNSTPETLELILQKDHYESAPKWAVARNKNASEKTLMSLSQSSENSWRVIGLIEDEMLNLKSLSKYPAEVQSYVAFAVAVNPSSSDAVLDQIQTIAPSLQGWAGVQLRNTQSSTSLPADEVVAQIKRAAQR